MKLRLARAGGPRRHRPDPRAVATSASRAATSPIGALTRHHDLGGSALLAAAGAAAGARRGPGRRPAGTAPRHDRRLAGARRPRLRPARRAARPRRDARAYGPGRAAARSRRRSSSSACSRPRWSRRAADRDPGARARPRPAGRFEKFTARAIDWAIVGRRRRRAARRAGQHGRDARCGPPPSSTRWPPARDVGRGGRAGRGGHRGVLRHQRHGRLPRAPVPRPGPPRPPGVARLTARARASA